jgi:hypothetical protein
VHAARGLRRVWAWIWAWIWAQRGGGVFGGVFGGGLGGVVEARRATWWWSSCPRRLRPDDIQEAPPSKQNETSPDADCFTCTRATRANPHRQSPESKDEIGYSNHRLGQFRISALVTRLNPNPGSYSRCRPAASQASPRAMTAHLEGSVVRDRKGTQTGGLASNNLKNKRRTINTSLVSETRERSALLLPDIPLDRTRAAASNGAPSCFVCVGVAEIRTSG